MDHLDIPVDLPRFIWVRVYRSTKFFLYAFSLFGFFSLYCTQGKANPRSAHFESLPRLKNEGSQLRGSAAYAPLSCFANTSEASRPSHWHFLDFTHCDLEWDLAHDTLSKGATQPAPLTISLRTLRVQTGLSPPLA